MKLAHIPLQNNSTSSHVPHRRGVYQISTRFTIVSEASNLVFAAAPLLHIRVVETASGISAWVSIVGEGQRRQT